MNPRERRIALTVVLAMLGLVSAPTTAQGPTPALVATPMPPQDPPARLANGEVPDAGQPFPPPPAQGSATNPVVSPMPGALAALLAPSPGIAPVPWALPLVGAFEEPFGFRLVFALDPRRPEGKNLVEVQLHRGAGPPDFAARTASFALRYLGPTEGGRPAGPGGEVFRQVLQAVARNDPGPAPGLSQEPAGERAPMEASAGPRQATWLDRAMVAGAFVLVLAFLAGLPLLLRGLWAEVRGSSRVLLAVLLAAGLALRLALPHRPIMYYMGYWLVQAASSLQEIPKHGPAGLVLDHLLFLLTGPDHRALSGLNAVLGALTPLAGAALLAVSGVGAVGVRAAVALLALAPVFLRDATTESLLVPTTLWALAGLTCWQRFRRDWRLSDALLAWTSLLLAVCSRPEFLVSVPLVLVLLPAPTARAAPLTDRRLPRPLAWTAIALAAALLGLRLAHLQEAVASEVSLGNLPVLRDPNALLALAPDLWRRNLALRPAWFPAAVTALALVSPLLPGHRRLAAGLLLAAVTGLAISLVDLPHVSLPRVQAPPLALLTLAAAVGLSSLLDRVPAGPARRATLAVAAASLAASLAASTAVLRERTNADDEEDLWRDVVAALPPGEVVLLRRGPEDQPVERLHLFHPDYWFRPPRRDDLVLNLDRLPALDPAGRPVYFVLSTRCWLRACGQRGLHPACARLMETYDLQPVFTREVPVRRVSLTRKVRPDQDLDFPWCVGRPDSLLLGLYRVGERRDGPPRPQDP